ncbi:endonuclease [Acuticoccus sediminis]|uniref:Endonuclease n=1 Tax=Acuticoccus sediminis TaxID=2184697 RepID=A0A8B2NIZ6_9HYPH|nr:endonuclease/exonuclease/phosphatase family protein [Acuticoccus sediminis]RAH97082.1 endonuclease [Acuticoccus sediminis]
MWRFLLALWVTAVPAAAQPAGLPAPKADGAVRFATFNAALTDDEPGGLVARLEAGDGQARLVAEVVQRVRPDVLLLQELDRDAGERSLALFRALLEVGEGGAEPIRYPYAVFPPSNTGVPSGVDLDGDGRAGGPNDALGFGHHPGQYAFALLSVHPVGEVRTFARLLWRDVPESLIPADYYSTAAMAVQPLSSKTHLAAPIAVGGATITVLAAHPTPPVFDDARDWNGRRNADEIRLLAAILDGADWAVDDAGVAGPAGGTVDVGAGGGHAVVMGDLNADPRRGDSRPGAMSPLLRHPRLKDVVPRGSEGDRTADFGGGMRVDYVLPTRSLEVIGAGVFWPRPHDPLARLNAASDHRLVWVDVRLP